MESGQPGSRDELVVTANHCRTRVTNRTSRPFRLLQQTCVCITAKCNNNAKCNNHPKCNTFSTLNVINTTTLNVITFNPKCSKHVSFIYTSLNRSKPTKLSQEGIWTNRIRSR